MFLASSLVFALASLIAKGQALSPTPSQAVAQVLPQAGQLASRVVDTVDDSVRVTLRGNVHPLALPRYDEGEAPSATVSGRIQLVLSRSPAQQQALTQYLADVQNPHSASYHRWLTPTEYGTRFGVADPDLAKVEHWLESHSFKVERVAAARNLIQFSGNFGQLESAFHTSIHTFQVNGIRHYANISDPQIPAALKLVIAAVGPLHDFHPTSQNKFGGTAHYDPRTHSIQPDLTLFAGDGTPYLYVDPADAATIYNTPNALLNRNYKGTSYDGTGISIGIAGDSNVTMQDIANYRTAFLGETAANANTPAVVVEGTDPGINGDEAEALLDTEVAGGIAPKAKILLYTAADTDLQAGLFLAIFRALDDNTVSILNISFGECEAGLGSSGNQLMLEIMTQAAAQGISVTVSTGDSGAAGCDADNLASAKHGFAVNGIASTPYNIAVGGTDYDDLPPNFSTYVSDSVGGKEDSGAPPYYGTALSYIPERPWNDSTGSNTDSADNFSLVSSNGSTDIVAGSGGVSSCSMSTTGTSGAVTCQGGYAKPAFQSALTPKDGVRDIPDVSFLAGNGLYQTAWLVCADNVAEGVGFPVFTDCATGANDAFTSSTHFSGFGGTSAAAPAFAGMLALIEQKTGSRLGQADDVLYQLAGSKYASVFHDVTTGNNSVVCTAGSPNCGANGFLTGYDAATGYDLASGLGSVDVTQLLTNWSTAGLAATSTTVNINGSTAALSVQHGANLTFSVGVSPATASGLVGIVDDANQNSGGNQNNGQFNIPIANGTGSAKYNGLPGGSYTVTAHYGGDSLDSGSTSSPGVPVTITPEASTTALALGVYSAATGNAAITNLMSVPYGSYYLGDVQIYGKAEGMSTEGLATGTVKFLDNGTVLNSGIPVNDASQSFYELPSAAYPTILAVGNHSMTVSYSGDSSYDASISAATVFTIVRGATNISVSPATASINSLASDQVTIAINTTSVGVIPTGMLTLSINGVVTKTFTSFLGGGDNEGGNSSYVVLSIQGSALKAGTNSISATYSGDGNYSGSSGSGSIAVSQATFALSNSGDISVAAGATTGNMSTIKVTPSNGFLGVVDLSCSVTTSLIGATPPTCAIPATVNVAGTLAVSTALSVSSTSATTTGAYTVTVAGVDVNTGKLTASTLVNVAVTSGAAIPSGGFALTNGGNLTVSPGAATGNTSTVTVTPTNGFTGGVSLTCAVTTSIASPTDPPICSIPASATISGTIAASATLTVNTTAPTTAMNQSPNGTFRSSPFNRSDGGKLGGIALAGLLVLVVPRKRRNLWSLASMLLLMVSFAAIGCGGSSSTKPTGIPGTTAGAYTVTVTGTDAATGKITQTTTISLTVN